jgi:hypothetical protein
MTPLQPHETHHSAAGSLANVAAPIEAQDAARALKRGPIGAFVVAGIAVGILFIGWLCFYFLLFMPRGSIG